MSAVGAIFAQRFMMGSLYGNQQPCRESNKGDMGRIKDVKVGALISIKQIKSTVFKALH